jgi:hypothetical protein
MSEKDSLLPPFQLIGSDSVVDDVFYNAVYVELESTGYFERLLEKDAFGRVEELRYYGELVENAQVHAWRLAVQLVAKNATRDKLLHPDDYQPVLYFEPETLALNDNRSVPYFVQMAVTPLPDYEQNYDTFRDLLYESEGPGFSQVSELLAAVPGVAIRFSFFEATTIPYSPDKHSGKHHMALDGKIALRRPEHDFVVSNLRPILSVDMLEAINEQMCPDEYGMALTDTVVEMKMKKSVFDYYAALLEDMKNRHMLYPDLDEVGIDE